MNKVTLQCFNIELTWPESNLDKAIITSDMRESGIDSDSPFNLCVESIETMILEHFVAGIDVTQPAYLVGIETAYGNVLKLNPIVEVPDGKILLNVSRRVTASVDEDIDYLVDEKLYRDALIEEGDSDAALQQLREQNKVDRVGYKSTVGDIHAEFECYITE